MMNIVLNGFLEIGFLKVSRLHLTGAMCKSISCWWLKLSHTVYSYHSRHHNGNRAIY